MAMPGPMAMQTQWRRAAYMPAPLAAMRRARSSTAMLLAPDRLPCSLMTSHEACKAGKTLRVSGHT